MSFCKDIGIGADNLDVLVIQAMMGNEDFMVVDRESFVDGLSKCGCSSKREIKQRVDEFTNAILTRKKVLKGFASCLFSMHAESSRIRTLDLSQSQELLMCFQMIFVKNP